HVQIADVAAGMLAQALGDAQPGVLHEHRRREAVLLFGASLDGAHLLDGDDSHVDHLLFHSSWPESLAAWSGRQLAAYRAPVIHGRESRPRTSVVLQSAPPIV